MKKLRTDESNIGGMERGGDDRMKLETSESKTREIKK